MKVRIYQLLIVISLLVGCVATGTKFVPVDFADTSKALIYVYRPFTPPVAMKPAISINGVEVAELSSKGYFEISIEPGKYTVDSDWSFLSGVPDGTATFEAKAGETYYVLIHTSMDIASFSPISGSIMPIFSNEGSITLVDDKTALPVIGQCKRIGNLNLNELTITPR